MLLAAFDVVKSSTLTGTLRQPLCSKHLKLIWSSRRVAVNSKAMRSFDLLQVLQTGDKCFQYCRLGRGQARWRLWHLSTDREAVEQAGGHRDCTYWRTVTWSSSKSHQGSKCMPKRCRRQSIGTPSNCPVEKIRGRDKMKLYARHETVLCIKLESDGVEELHTIIRIWRLDGKHYLRPAIMQLQTLVIIRPGGLVSKKNTCSHVSLYIGLHHSKNSFWCIWDYYLMSVSPCLCHSSPTPSI